VWYIQLLVLNPDPLYPTTEVSQLCPSATSTCNGGTNPGVYKCIPIPLLLRFLLIVLYTVSYGECCRNTSNNLASSQSFDLYVETTINTNNALCNNGPRFTTYPVPYYCIGSQYSYSHGTYDIDGDSLVYFIGRSFAILRYCDRLHSALFSNEPYANRIRIYFRFTNRSNDVHPYYSR
jgi:hypothetical protein